MPCYFFSKFNYVKTIRMLATGCDYLILFLDCDDEGEKICFEVIDIVKDVVKSSARVFR